MAISTRRSGGGSGPKTYYRANSGQTSTRRNSISSRSYNQAGSGNAGGWSGGSQQWNQPQTQQTYIPGFSLTTPQDAWQIQQGQSAAQYQMGIPASSGSQSLEYQSYVNELASLQQAAESTATATAATVPITTTTTTGTSWFSEQTIISGVPNWAIAAGGAFLLLFMMRRR